MSRTEILDQFTKYGTLLVTFTKKNGDERKMVCTRSIGMIPESQHPSDDHRKDNSEIVTAYDLESAGWRSFRVESVISLEYS